MPSRSTRRYFVGLAGSALFGLSGCADAVDRLDADESDAVGVRTAAGSTDHAGPTTAAGGPTTADAGSPTEATRTRTETATPSLDLEPPDVSFADVPIPEAPEEHDYATMGRSDATATATVFGNWKCPYTRAFVLEHLPDVVDRYVRPGDLVVEFRALAYRSDEPFLGPDAPRAARAGLGVWDVDPGSYWSYFGYVFGNQPPEADEWATTEHLSSFADAAGVEDTDALRRSIQGDEHASAVRSTTTAAAGLDVFTVPRVAVDGEVTAPTVDPESTREQLDGATGRRDGS